MKITSVETIKIQLPTRRAHTAAGILSTGAAKLGGYLIIRLHTDEGLVGLGEAPTLIQWGGDHGRYFGESQQTAAHVIADYLVPALAGEDPRNIEAIHERMNRVVKGHPYAKSAIDMACYDLMGKATGQPAYVFLGGAYRTEIRLAHSFGMNMSPDHVQAEAEVVLGEGFKTLKVKVSADSKRDVEVVKRLRALGGPDVEITVDANQGWPDPRTAADAIARMDQYDVAIVEQPVEGIDQMAEVKRLIRPRLMADESAWTTQDIYELAEKRAADVISLYYTKPGGMHPGQKVAAVCEAVGFHANLNGSAETGIGNAANLHLTAACKIIDLACVVMVNAPAGRAPTKMGGHFYTDDLITQPYGYRDGHILVPDGPGLGVVLDEEKLAKYRLD